MYINRQKVSIFAHADEEKKNNTSISCLLGIADKDFNLDSLPQCENCRKFTDLLQAMDHKQKLSHRKWRKIKGVLHQMEAHNESIVRNTDDAIRGFEHYIMKLELEIIQRDEMIATLGEQIQDLKLSSDELLAQQKQQTNQIEAIKNLQLGKQQKQIDGLKSHICRQISEKAAIERRAKQQWSKVNEELKKMQMLNQLMQSQICSKQKLILFLSNSNNDLVAELIELRGKVQMGLSTCTTCITQSRISSDRSQIDKELIKENEKLLDLNSGLQSNIQSLIKQTQEMETKLVKVKLQKDIWQKKAENKKSRSFDLQPKCVCSRSKEHYSPNPNRQLAGTIRINRI